MTNVLLGVVAGAAGTVALDMTSYGDIALRGRSLSNTPAELVRLLSDKAGIEPLNKPDDDVDEATKNRRGALGALSGYLVGLTIGAAYGVASPLFGKVPLGLKAVLIGALAMAAADVPAAKLGATKPAEWGVSGWLGDIVPHVAYGLVTAAVFDSLSAAISS